MEVYRVEHIGSGDGPFRDGGYKYFRTEIPYENERLYPSVGADGLHIQIPIGQTRLWYTAVLSRNKINYWFPHPSDFRTYLKENGYKISTYDVHPDDVRHGRSGHQVVFFKARAKKLSTEEL